MPRPTRLDEVGCIYFIESPEQEAVKIGFTENVYMRLKSVQTGNPAELEMTHSLAATFGAEKALHDLLEPYRIRLEWFAEPALMEFVAVELLDTALDRALEAAPNVPQGSSIEDVAEIIQDAKRQQVITKDDVAAIVPAVIAEYERSRLVRTHTP